MLKTSFVLPGFGNGNGVARSWVLHVYMSTVFIGYKYVYYNLMGLCSVILNVKP